MSGENKQGKSFTSEQIERLLNSCYGKTLGEIDSSGVFIRYAGSNKGLAGDVIEQSVLGYPPDSRKYPDIVIDGVETEVKTTGLRMSKGTAKSAIEAKEPMSITAVSINEIWREEFETSSFWHKCAHMLLVFYLYEGNKVPASMWSTFEFMGWDYCEWSEEERRVLESDWSIVRDFVVGVMRSEPEPESRERMWPLISTRLNRELMFLDTAPKYPNPPRFRLKRQVVTALWQARQGKNIERLRNGFASYSELDERLHGIASEYAGKTMRELAAILGYKGEVSKQMASSMVVRMLGGTSKSMANVGLFAESGMIGKCVTVTVDGQRTENTKLFRIDFSEVEDPDVSWEDSAFRAGFAGTQLLCTVFEEPGKSAELDQNRFLGFKRLAFSEEFVETDVRKCWDDMRDVVLSGRLRSEVQRYKSGERKGEVIYTPKTNLPKESVNLPKSVDHKVFVNGTGADASQKTELVSGVRMYAQNVWVRGDWICGELMRLPYL